MTAQYTAADSSSVALAEEELAAILVRVDNPPVDDVAMLHHAAELICEIPRLVAELTRARGALRIIAGGYTDAEAPDVMKLEPMEFRAAMWTWSQRKARAALGEEPADLSRRSSEGA